MNKQVLIYLCCLLFLFPRSDECEAAVRRGLFVTVVQEPTVLSSRKDIGRLVDFAKSAHIGMLFVQIYRANQAWFPSKIADSSPYEACLKKVSEDPIRLLTKEAHAKGIQVHAWLNMLSLGENKNAPILKKYGTGILTRNTRMKKRLEDYKIDDQYFLEPGDPRIRQDLVEIVGEALSAYPELDGIQFDYIRYPDMKPAYGYTKINRERFKEATGIKTIDESSRAWKDWKRAQVTELLRQLVKKARSIRPKIQVSATGCMPYSRAYHEAFQDWPSWIESGLVDFVTVMNYSASTAEFENWIAEAKKITKKFNRVNIAVGAYKLTDYPGVFNKEFGIAQESGGFACTVFHYGSLVQNPVLGNILFTGGRPSLVKTK